MYIYCFDRNHDKKGYSRFEIKESDEIEKEFQKELQEQAEQERKKEEKQKKKSADSEEVVTQIPDQEQPQQNK
jgi:hypothetical protein